MISEILSEGAENALTSREICEILHLSARELTAAVERERRAGIPICASTGKNPGYFLATHKEEMNAYCNSLRHRAIEIFKTRKACVDTMKGLPEEEIIRGVWDEKENRDPAGG